MRFALLLLLCGCRTAPLDIGAPGTDGLDLSHIVPVGDMAVPITNTEPCTAWNELNSEHFAVVAAAIKACLDTSTGCQFHPTWIYFPGLPDGVGDVSFNWGDNFDGTFSMFGQGIPDNPSAPKGIIFSAAPIPASVGFHPALRAFYLGTPPAGCTWH
jgi:hypothetical protein